MKFIHMNVHLGLLRELYSKQFGYIVTENDKYLILFSGKIWISDLLTFKIRESSIICPIPAGSDSEEEPHALNMGEEIDEILSCGYIRDCWSEDEMKSLRYPPMYLIKIIKKYFCDEVIYLFENYDSMSHWKIKLNDILN